MRSYIIVDNSNTQVHNASIRKIHKATWENWRRWNRRQDICIALFRENSPLECSEWHVLTKDDTDLPVTHTFIHHWNESSCLYCPTAAHYRTLAGTYFPSNRGQEAELAWVAGYIPRWYARPKAVINPSTNRPIVRRPGIELTTIESQVRRPNH